MARFIGQRVRVRWVNTPDYQHLVGEEGVITEVRQGPPHVVYGLDISPLEIMLRSGVLRVVGFAADQLEPIQPSGHQPCEQDFKLDLDRLLEREGVSA